MRNFIILLAIATLPACATQNRAAAPQATALAQVAATDPQIAPDITPDAGQAPAPGARAALASPEPEPAADATEIDTGRPVPPEIVTSDGDPGEPAVSPALAALVNVETPQPVAVSPPAAPARFDPWSETLRLDESVVAMIKRHHGLRTDAYQGVAGNWLIGYGRAKGARPGMSVSAAEADAFLREDLAVIGRQVRAALSRPVSANEFSAMVALAHSIGTGAFRQSAVRALFNRGDRQGAADAFLQWNTMLRDGRRVEDPKLTAQRMRERTHFLAGGLAEAAQPDALALSAESVSREEEPGRSPSG